MALKEYQKKRVFQDTPEPRGGKSGSSALQFVVQKHDANRLHYDFRLEMDGVLKSWAVPKGPSLNPEDKRLAMMVEDHPFDYKDFEGIIPEGNYGAGQVIVWDQGTYEPLEKSGSKKDQEKELLKELKSGSLKFRLKGKKLKGEFALVHIKNNQQKGDNAWLLIKHRDDHAAKTDITQKDKSVVSGKTIGQVGKDKKAKTWISNRSTSAKASADKPAKAPTSAKASADKPAKAPTLARASADKSTKGNNSTKPSAGKASLGKENELKELIKKGKKSSFPRQVKPMLATLVEKPFGGADWIFEVKWDGYRAVARTNSGKTHIESRNQISFDGKFGPVKAALEQWAVPSVLDGEIIALDKSGRPDFQELQGYLKGGKAARLAFCVFDLLWYEGRDYSKLPLLERKTILQSILPANDEILQYSDHLADDGISFFEAAIARGLEGIMAKKADSPYTQAVRTKNWLKIKNNRLAEVIICGFTKGRESRKYFGAVILGRYDRGKLVYVGHSGSGFDDATLKDLYACFRPLITDECPFKPMPKTNMPATWLKPELVCLVKYTEETRDGYLRHPIFAGLREDKKASDERRVAVVPANTKIKKQRSPVNKKQDVKKVSPRKSQLNKVIRNKKPVIMAKSSRTRADLLVSSDEKQKDLVIQKHSLSLSNLKKIYWPKEKISKGDMINYYHQVAEYILPFLKDRPQSLNRHPNGINGETFYQKNVGDQVPSWIKTHPYISESDGKTRKFLVASDEASLIYMANLGCIEMNPWNSRVQKPANPDWCVIDIDPDKSNTFKQVIEVALQVRSLLEQLKIKSFCKTSGSTGMHIYIPLGAQYSYDQSRMFAQLVVTAVQHELSSFTSIERSLSKRKGKIYLDFLQNRQIQTIAAPYSLRPKPGATVSMPLDWDEVKPGLKMQDFNLYNALARIREQPDAFKGVLGPGINLDKALAAMEKR